MKLKYYTIAMKNTRYLMASVTLLFALSSCTSYKKIPYFQDLDRSKVTNETIDNYSSLTIQPLDQLSLSVQSLNPEASSVFNNNLQNAGTSTTNANYGYTVDKNGEVKLPLVGTMKVAGLTNSEFAQQLQQRLLTFLKEPTVTVNILNFKVAVLGDVMKPNIYTSPSERLTITEALSLAGDLNVTAKRDDITLVRERNGKREYIPIDLTSKKLFQSPYFYMKNNDLLFVQPSKLKLANVDTGYRNASLIISALSLLAISYSILR